MIIALTRTLTRREPANVILTLTPPLTHVKGGIKYLNGFAMQSIPVKARSNMSISLTPVLTWRVEASKDTTALAQKGQHKQKKKTHRKKKRQAKKQKGLKKETVHQF